MTTPATEESPRVEIPWGSEPPLLLEIPKPWEVVGVARPDLSESIADYPTALGQALDEPLSGSSLFRSIRAGSTVAIVVDDPTR